MGDFATLEKLVEATRMYNEFTKLPPTTFSDSEIAPLKNMSQQLLPYQPESYTYTHYPKLANLEHGPATSGVNEPQKYNSFYHVPELLTLSSGFILILASAPELSFARKVLVVLLYIFLLSILLENRYVKMKDIYKFRM